MKSLHASRRRVGRSPWVYLVIIGAMFAGTSGSEEAVAQVPTSADTLSAVRIDTLRVNGRIDDLSGIAVSASEGRVGAVDLRSRPLAREGELLETVPGVIVTQHSGEGKANQYFVRGFNLDHGTDFQTRVEGMPINMPTHGHGQGYTDLNFLIPEFVELLDYRLGVYHAEMGDFGSAGGAEFHLARRLDRPFASLTGGTDGFFRAVAGGSTRIARGDLLVGGEGRVYDGPWDLPQEIRKFNGLIRYSRELAESRFSLMAMGYDNQWNSSDQIPLRAVESGEIGRFGHIDPTDGGLSSRYSLSGAWSRYSGGSSQHVEFFGIFSELSLFSNFTYLLGDPESGDQFEQRDKRSIFGVNARHSFNLGFDGRHAVTAGIQTRLDRIGEVGLHLANDRVRSETVREDEVTEATAGVHLEMTSRWHPMFRSVLGARADAYTFDVKSDLAANSGDRTASILSPKASLIFSPAASTEVYVSGGFGFHSNDARGTTITIDPATGDPAEPVDPLVRSRGGELGLRLTPVEGLRSTVSAWVLDLESELLFVGDAGATEPSDGSRRMGITFANFWRPLPALSLDADLSLARARLLDVYEGEDRIPGALESVLAGGITWAPEAGAFGSLRVRSFGEYPLIEDNAVRAESATLVNGSFGWRLASGTHIELALLNLFDTDAYDIQYLYESRLPGEPTAGVEDVHFHPVEPRQLRLTVQYRF